jgi:hypothetical protein
MRYRVLFSGRPRGAIGITYRHDVTVEARDEESARMVLYETHEHISIASTREIEPEGEKDRLRARD